MSLSRYVAILLAAVWSLVLTPRAHAHAVLLESVPKAGAQIAEAPKEVILKFNENVGPVFFKVLDRAGHEVGAPGEVQLDGNDLHLPLMESLAHGTYAVTFRVVSADTHPVSGTFVFAVGEAVAAAGMAETKASAWTPFVGLNRFVLYAAMTLAAGSALFRVLVPLPAEADAVCRQLGLWGAVVAAVAFVLGIGIGGSDLLLGDVGVLFTAKAWHEGGNTTLLPSALIGVPSMLILAFAMRRPADRWLSVTGAALAILSFLVTGHAATASPVIVTAPMVALHLVGVAFWLGALAPLAVAARTAPLDALGRVLERFSTLAVIAVTLLVASGCVLTVVQVAATNAMITTSYGNRLIVKLGLFAVLLGFAGYNKLFLTPAIEHGDAAAAGRLRRSIAVEIGLYLLILAAAASLTLTPPPRTLKDAPVAAMPAADGFKASAREQGYTADISVDPARAGENMLMVTVKDASGAAVKLESVEVTLALPGGGIAEVEKKAEPAGAGMWHVMASETIIPGTWEVKVRAFLNGFDTVDFAFQVPIR